MGNIVMSINVIFPIIFTLLFGFIVEKINLFKNITHSLATINTLVLKCTLPAALFIGTVTINKVILYQEFTLFLALLICSFLAFFIGFFLIKYVFKRNDIECSIAALMISFSAGPLYGPALLENLYGLKGDASVAMMSLVINVFLIPIATIIIKIVSEKRKGKESISFFKLIAHSLNHAIIQTPFVTAPLIAIFLVIINIKIPEVLLHSLNLMGKASAGLSIFVGGMTIAVNQIKINKEVLLICLLKNIAIPLLYFKMAPFFQLEKIPSLFNQGLLLMALPSGPIIVLLATQYHQYQQEASSALALSTIGMLITVTYVLMNIS